MEGGVVGPALTEDYFGCRLKTQARPGTTSTSFGSDRENGIIALRGDSMAQSIQVVRTSNPSSPAPPQHVLNL